MTFFGKDSFRFASLFFLQKNVFLNLLLLKFYESSDLIKFEWLKCLFASLDKNHALRSNDPYGFENLFIQEKHSFSIPLNADPKEILANSIIYALSTG